MPCRCDYPELSAREIEARKVLGFLKEVGVAPEPFSEYMIKTLDANTAKLCDFCSREDVTRYSLELQIWWRDHREADRKRREEALREAEEASERRAALAKLSKRERKLLGID